MIDFVNEIEDMNLMQVSMSKLTLPANSFCASKSIPKSLGNQILICPPEGFQYLRKDLNFTQNAKIQIKKCEGYSTCITDNDLIAAYFQDKILTTVLQGYKIDRASKKVNYTE